MRLIDTIRGPRRMAPAALCALLLFHCAPSRYVMKVGGRRVAEFTRGESGLDITAYDRDGSRMYESAFIPGCKGVPGAGREVPGTRFRYDSRGNIRSHWEIDPDTAHAVFTEEGEEDGKQFSRRFVYRGRNLDSIVHTGANGKVRAVHDFGGNVCINISPAYIEFLRYTSFISTQGHPFLYDTLVVAAYDSAGKAWFRHTTRPDSIIQIGFGKTGNVTSRHECSAVDDEYCQRGEQREWFENGKLSKQHADAGSRRVHRHWYESGQLMTESFYKGTKLDSVYQSWHENGILNQRIVYRLGEEIRSEEWDKDGKPVKK